MLDIGWTELLVIAVVLIVVVGPKDLPPMLRAFGKMTSNLRKMAGDFRTQFDEALKEADMDGVRQTIGDAQRFHPANAIREAINPLREMGNEIRNDLQKVTESPNASAVEPEQAAVATSIEDLIPEPSLSLPDNPPISPPPVASPTANVAGDPAKAPVGSPAAASGAASPAISTPAPLVAAPNPSVQATGAAVVGEATVTPKPARARKPAAVKLAAPGVPAVVSVDDSEAVLTKKTRSRKASAADAQLTGGADAGAKTSTKRSAVTRSAVQAEAAPVEQAKVAAPRKKKTSAPKDQI